MAKKKAPKDMDLPRRDLSITAETFALRVAKRRPSCFIRFADGEFISMLGPKAVNRKKGTNCDGHSWMPGTLGKELIAIVDNIRDLSPENEDVFVGWSTHFPKLMTRMIQRRGWGDTVPWIQHPIWEVGLEPLTTLEFFKAAAKHKVLLIGNKTLQPLVGKGLGAKFVEVPMQNAYNTVAQIVSAADTKLRGGDYHVVLVSSGMAAEPIIWRLRSKYPKNAYFDTGSIFDGIAGRLSRNYMRLNRHGRMDLLNKHYIPWFKQQVAK